MKKKRAEALGRYIVCDPKICHGKPTFRGTRIFVADVLEQVAQGIAWETIVEQWRGKVSAPAIAEAVRLASDALLSHAQEMIPESAAK
jgi:uncharacterized protein (DUF433 family)